MVQVKTSGFDLHKFYTPAIRDQQLKPHQQRVDKAAAQVVLSTDKAAEVGKLQTLMQNMQSDMKALSSTAGLNDCSVFDAKTAVVTTNDVGIGADYVDVITTKGANKGQINLQVKKLAAAASLTARLKDAASLASNLKLVVNYKVGDTITASTQIAIAAQGNISMSEIAEQLNEKFNSSDGCALKTLYAVVSKGHLGHDFLVIKNSLTGKGTIDCKLVTSDNNPAIDARQLEKQATPGEDAEINVDGGGGVTKTSSTNIFNDVLPGISLSLNKVNDPHDVGKNLTITIKDDPNALKAKIESFITNYNKFVEFFERQQITTIDLDSEGCVKDSARLGDLTVLAKANQLFNSIVSQVTGVRGASSLSDIGIRVTNNKLAITDLSQFSHATLHNLAGVKQIFQTSVKITTATNNVSLSCAARLEGQAVKFASHAQRTNLSTNVTLYDDGAGNITFSVNAGSLQRATLIGNLLTFPGTDLEGLKLKYIAAGGEQKFSFALTCGIADEFSERAINVLSAVDRELKGASHAIDRLKDKEQKLRATLTKEQKKVDNTVSRLEFLAFEFEAQMDKLDQLADFILHSS